MSDGEFTSDPANVTIRVNSPPIAKIKRYVVYEDSVFERDDEFGLISKSTDSELDDLSVVLVSEPQHGLLSLSNDGSFVYTPEADYSGFDVFEFALNDGYQNSTPVQCQIYIIDVDDAPVAKDDDFFVSKSNEHVFKLLSKCQVSIDDAQVADDLFHALMGDEVEPRGARPQKRPFKQFNVSL